MWNDMKLAIAFLSRVPVPLKQNKGNLKKICAYFTFVGYLAGVFYFSMKLISENFLWTLLSVALGFYLFDLFHFDGLLDTLDGFFYQGTKERRFEIMSKGDIGPFAFFYAALYIVAYLYAFLHVDPIDLIYVAVLGRFSMNILLHFGKPAKNTGLGKLLHPYEKKHTLISLVFTIPLVYFPLNYIISLSIALLLGSSMHFITNRKIEGYTGDVLGATCMFSQLSIMVALSLI
ncbi:MULTISPECIES: adenosylcobinamide-GDP ribazoletransferase [Kosmotoga]|uniref:Adenosylcobinamide-GDP ribazoletransferase n=1 Tax=Kosmotoga olearia (strain ATCC BAA-1733 / DSM 21960 / TBF 19.5.1) TaxID=521045 RepID=COBS_KOSOT|nr:MULTISPECIES: adenosylcobinamide-GDP ribazoletransferase [Kosmotoga]C5CE71.1 RecName: Full=Adenosylcobinamide-GDP ribazoletransferase; AltName: Full=Cobalamin synthase; AltName: Full=Cobalamin-5'-phosphate synthase [Kosmotoga olearia TBF 19.5.1]ACR79179.1 cobalamin-5-phosphate synthase CobS [Kosmotoga olearia TBF 19.5.1]